MGKQTETGHPKGLYLLFFTEMWERFSYYGMRSIFTLYLIEAMLMDKASASNIYGDYTGLVYLTPLIGGYLSDRYLGNRRSILIGGIVMSLGQFAMFASASFLGTSLSMFFMVIGLFLLIVGNGFFKPNISSMVGQLYADGDTRTDSAYTIFYMGINFGAFFSPLICGTLALTGNPEDFKWGYLASSIGMIIGVVAFQMLGSRYLVTQDGRPIGLKVSEKSDNKEDSSSANNTLNSSSVKKIVFTLLFECVGFGIFYWMFDGDIIGSLIFSFCLTVPFYILSDASLTKTEKEGITAVFVIAFFVIFFWSAFEQAGASLTYFANEEVDRNLNIGIGTTRIVVISVVCVIGIVFWLRRCMSNGGETLPGVLSMSMVLMTVAAVLLLDGHEVNTSYFQSLNPICIIVFAPVMSALWLWLDKKGIGLSSPRKQALGLALLSIGYFVIAYGTSGISEGAKVSMMWIVSLYFILSIGELSLSPIGLSLVSRLSPLRFSSLMMSVWLLSSATANKLSGTLSALYPVPGEAPKVLAGYSIENLTDFFLIFAVSSAAAALALFLVCRWLDGVIERAGK